MHELFHENETLSCLYYEDIHHVVCNETTYDQPEEKLTSANPTFWLLLGAYIFLVLVCGKYGKWARR